MASRNVFHVVQHENAWAVRREGVDSLSASHLDEDQALERAVEFVRTLGVGRVVVHGEDGRITAVHTYDRLPTFDERSWLDAVMSRPALVAGAAFFLIGVGVALARRD